MMSWEQCLKMPIGQTSAFRDYMVFETNFFKKNFISFCLFKYPISQLQQITFYSEHERGADFLSIKTGGVAEVFCSVEVLQSLEDQLSRLIGLRVPFEFIVPQLVVATPRPDLR